MSEENVETIRRVFADGDVDASAAEFLHPDVELLGAVGGMEEGEVTRGREAVWRAMSVDLDVWAERRMELRRVFDAGDRVVAFIHEYRRGKGSGALVEADIAVIYRFVDGKVDRIEPYMTPAAALEAAGIRE